MPNEEGKKLFLRSWLQLGHSGAHAKARRRLPKDPSSDRGPEEPGDEEAPLGPRQGDRQQGVRRELARVQPGGDLRHGDAPVLGRHQRDLERGHHGAADRKGPRSDIADLEDDGHRDGAPQGQGRVQDQIGRRLLPSSGGEHGAVVHDEEYAVCRTVHQRSRLLGEDFVVHYGNVGSGFDGTEAVALS